MVMTMTSFKARLAALEALDNAQPTGPAYVCLHQHDYDALDSLTTPADVRAAIVDAYELGQAQKWYVGVCLCIPPEMCRVCSDTPVSEGHDRGE